MIFCIVASLFDLGVCDGVMCVMFSYTMYQDRNSTYHP